MIELYADGIAPHEGNIAKLINVYGIKGCTANPALVKNYLPMSYCEYSKFMVNNFKGLPVSIQVLSSDLDEMVSEGVKIASWGKDVYVKVPIINEEGKSCIPVILDLLSLGIQVNVTAIFTAEQVNELMDYYMPASVNVILSVFSGRIGDTGRSPNAIIEPISKIVSGRSNIKILWAGVRSISDIIEAKKYCDIITLPQSVLDKIPLHGKNLDEFCLETVQMFAKEAKNFTI